MKNLIILLLALSSPIHAGELYVEAGAGWGVSKEWLPAYPIGMFGIGYEQNVLGHLYLNIEVEHTSSMIEHDEGVEVLWIKTRYYLR